MYLKIVVKDGGRTVMTDFIKVLMLQERFLKQVFIPGFKNTQIQELIAAKSVSYRHLGLDYFVKVTHTLE